MKVILAPRYLSARTECERRFAPHMCRHNSATQISEVLAEGHVIARVKLIGYRDVIWAEERLRGLELDEVITVGAVPPALLQQAQSRVRSKD